MKLFNAIKAMLIKADGICEECGKPFKRLTDSYASRNKRFCSKECYRRHYMREYMRKRRAGGVNGEQNI